MPFYLFLLFPGLPSAKFDELPARHICWIDSVFKKRHGVTITFVDQSRGLDRLRGNKSVRLLIDKSAPPKGDVVGGVMRLREAPAKVGDVISTSNSPEDVCVLHVVSLDGHDGVEAEAAFHPPGATGTHAKEFIKAEVQAHSP